MSLMLAGQHYEMIAMLPNHAGGFVGEAVWDAQMLIANMDPAWIGYYFDPSQTQAWEAALRMALPRIKAVAVQDFYWEKTGNTWAQEDVSAGRRDDRLGIVLPNSRARRNIRVRSRFTASTPRRTSWERKPKT